MKHYPTWWFALAFSFALAFAAPGLAFAADDAAGGHGEGSAQNTVAQQAESATADDEPAKATPASTEQAEPMRNAEGKPDGRGGEVASAEPEASTEGVADDPKVPAGEAVPASPDSASPDSASQDSDADKLESPSANTPDGRQGSAADVPKPDTTALSTTDSDEVIADAGNVDGTGATSEENTSDAGEESTGKDDNAPGEDDNASGKGDAGQDVAESTPATPKVPKAKITYRAKVGKTWEAAKSAGKKAGSTAESMRITGIDISVSAAKRAKGSVQYQVHASKAGWADGAADGQQATITASDSVDGIRIALTGKLSTWYSVAYRVYVAGEGWLDWAQDGAVAGIIGSGSPIQAIKVKLVKRAEQVQVKGEGIVSLRYRAKSKGSGWSASLGATEIAGTTEPATRMKDLRIDIETGSYGGGVKYRAHTVSGSWTPWTKSWDPVGSRNIDAIQVKLAGKIAKSYDIVYRTHVAGIGWQRRFRNGETAGSIESGRYISALSIELQAKDKPSGWVRSDAGWSLYEDGKLLSSRWITTDESPINTSITAQTSYWLDADGLLAVSRFVNPLDERDGKARFVAYATESGERFVGKLATGEGIVFTTKAGKVYTTARWLTTARFDGSKQKYRLAKHGFYAIARTGLFKVDGKKYYGWEDGRGYVMRSTTWWVADNWYKASAAGVLKNVSSKTTQHIDRYVKWAVRIANDDSHGYSQYHRWGPDYDCSSLVCSALLAAGFPGSGALWTGNMVSCLTKIGFVWHPGTYGLRRGDIMLVHNSSLQHTEIYIGNNQLVGAHISELGTVYGKEGDQTGREISVGGYYNAPWEGFLRYRG